MDYQLYGPRFKANPYPVYAAMRRHDPVYRRLGHSSDRPIWFVTRYEYGEAVLLDHRRYVKNFRAVLAPAEEQLRPPEPYLVRLVSNHMLNLDAPDHTRLRSLVARTFTSRPVADLQGRVQALAHGQIDRMLARSGSHGAADLMDEYAFPLAVAVIAELMGLPPEEHLRYRRWTAAFVSPFKQASEIGKKASLLQSFVSEMDRLFQERRRRPRRDLLTALIQVEEAGDRLSNDELHSMVVLLLVAGHETVANLIGNGVLALLQRPDQLALLQADPARMAATVDELARFDGPVERATTRFALEDTHLGDRTIARGDAVNVALAATSRDPDRFSDPDTLDITRPNNRHLAFGAGTHYCLGAALARMEVAHALEVLFHRLPTLHLAVPADTIRWQTTPITRGMKALPIAWR